MHCVGEAERVWRDRYREGYVVGRCGGHGFRKLGANGTSSGGPDACFI